MSKIKDKTLTALRISFFTLLAATLFIALMVCLRISARNTAVTHAKMHTTVVGVSSGPVLTEDTGNEPK